MAQSSLPRVEWEVNMAMNLTKLFWYFLWGDGHYKDSHRDGGRGMLALRESSSFIVYINFFLIYNNSFRCLTQILSQAFPPHFQSNWLFPWRRAITLIAWLSVFYLPGLRVQLFKVVSFCGPHFTSPGLSVTNKDCPDLGNASINTFGSDFTECIQNVSAGASLQSRRLPLPSVPPWSQDGKFTSHPAFWKEVIHFQVAIYLK